MGFLHALCEAKTSVNFKDVVKQWAKEKKDYDSEASRCKAGKQCSNYEQVGKLMRIVKYFIAVITH